jgi:TctA family transporter
MTNEQLTEKVIELLAYREKAQEEHETFKNTLTRLQNNMDTFTKLAEDVHIMAINMENMQKAQDEMNKKVDALTSKEFLEYKETKKLIKQNLINKIVGGFIGALITGGVWILTMYFGS